MSEVQDRIDPPPPTQREELPAMSEAPQPSEPRGADLAPPDDTVIGRAFAWSLVVIGGLGVIVGGGVWWANRKPPEVGREFDPPERPLPRIVTARTEIPKALLVDITEASGLDFWHFSGARGEKLLPETMGPGCAFLDFDNDGDQDILLVNSCDWPWTQAPRDPPPTTCLYANDGTGQFTNVTAGSGLDVTFYGQGVAVGDYDNDGWVDVYLTGVARQPEAPGANRLFHNEQGKFVDVTAEAQVAGEPGNWSISAGFLDYDNDGDLDLFVGNYVRWSREKDLQIGFTLDGVRRAYGRPHEFEGTFPYLFRNEGAGKFREVGEEAGLHVRTKTSERAPLAKTLGVAPIDLDDDGWIDVIVANDTVPNLLFHNRRGRFVEVGVPAGIAFNNEGAARGAMGIDVAQIRPDGTLGVAIGNFSNEMTALYVSPARAMQFYDAALSTGLGPPTRLQLTFGVVFLDFDLDGRQDLLEANGHLERDISIVQANLQHAQPPVLFWYAGLDSPVEFIRVEPAACGADLGVPMVGRGAAVADIDGDGDQDVLLTANGGQPRLLRNDQQLGRHWLRFKLIGRQANRDAIGAWIEVHQGGQVMRRQVMPTRSYLSQSELPVTVGLGGSAAVEKVVVRWPGGKEQVVERVQVDALNVIEEEVAP